MESLHSQTTILLMIFELLTNSLYFLFYFSLERLHLLLIITFKARRLNNIIDFFKKNLQFAFTLEFVMRKKKQQNGDPRNGQTLVCFKKFLFPSGSFTQDDSPYWVHDSGILGQVWINFSSFRSFHDVKFQSEISPVKFSFGLMEVLFPEKLVP